MISHLNENIKDSLIYSTKNKILDLHNKVKEVGLRNKLQNLTYDIVRIIKRLIDFPTYDKQRKSLFKKILEENYNIISKKDINEISRDIVKLEKYSYENLLFWFSLPGTKIKGTQTIQGKLSELSSAARKILSDNKIIIIESVSILKFKDFIRN